jgi:hypothetical protein
MKRALLLLTTLLLLAAEGGSSQARPPDAPDQAPPGPSPAAPAHDPLEEFVPREKLEADSVVAMPVDI